VQVKKRVLADLEMVYAVCSVVLQGELHLLAATETHGRCLLFSPPDWKPSTVWDGPGGTMNLTPIPGREAIIAIQDFYPIFRSERAGVVWAEPGENAARMWAVRRILDLPFVHRIVVVETQTSNYLVAATLCSGKDYQDDWSKPGTVYAGIVPNDPTSHWEIEPVLRGISKNHGMHVTTLDNRLVVLISGQEGLFALEVPRERSEHWTSQLLIDREISDMCTFDADGDGCAEIVTIEPFHGDVLAVYKAIDGRFIRICEEEIAFGHVCWAGTVLGEPSLLVASRGGSKEMALLRVTGTEPMTFDRTVLDRGVGATQVAVLHNRKADLILSANHAVGEVALYELTSA